MTIGKEILEAATRLAGSLLLKHKDEIDKAYLKAENALKIDLGVTFKPAENGEVKVAVGIGFVTDRVKDDISGQMKEGQMDMFEEAEQKKKKASNQADKEEETKALNPAKPELTSGNVIEADFTKEEGSSEAL
jgi:hypothetical protein